MYPYVNRKRLMRKLPLAIVFLCAWASLPALYAQTPPAESRISDWYQEERFILADKNEDALLSRKEITQQPQEFAYFLAGQNYQLTDLNRDGFLSFNEITQRRRAEFLYRYQMEGRALRELGQEHPLLAQVDLSYLKEHPELVSRLLGNYLWMAQNKELAGRLVRDKYWMSQHPEALRALHSNLRWMAANPGDARQLYQDRGAIQILPHLMGWRAAHLDFIRRYHPEGDYSRIFLPEGDW